MPTPIFAPLLEQTASHPKIDDLSRLVRDCLFDAAARRSSALEPILASRCREASISREDAQTTAGNVLDSLAHPTEDPAASRLAGLLVARALMASPPQGVEAEDDTAGKLVWIATELDIDVLAALDEVAPERAKGLWGAVADLVQRHDARGAGITRAEAIVAASSLAASPNTAARERVPQLLASIKSSVVLRVLAGPGAGHAPAAPPLSGELSPAPRGPVATFFLGMIGWLFLSHSLRLVARFALRYQRPAQISVTPGGIVVQSSTRLVGKVLRESQTLLPLDGLVKATREVRFPRAATYAGLITLALGSYLGVSWFVDGVRAGSFSLAAVGLLVMALGIGLDFLLLSVIPGRQGKCRLVLVPKRGAATCVGAVDASSADAFLRALEGKLR